MPCLITLGCTAGAPSAHRRGVITAPRQRSSLPDGRGNHLVQLFVTDVHDCLCVVRPVFSSFPSRSPKDTEFVRQVERPPLSGDVTTMYFSFFLSFSCTEPQMLRPMGCGGERLLLYCFVAGLSTLPMLGGRGKLEFSETVSVVVAGDSSPAVTVMASPGGS